MNLRPTAGSPDHGPGFRRFGIPLPDTQEIPVVPDAPARRPRHLALPLISVSIVGTAIGLMLPTGAPDTTPVPSSSTTTRIPFRSPTRSVERLEASDPTEYSPTRVRSTSEARTASRTAIQTVAPKPSTKSIRSTPPATTATPSGKPSKTWTSTTQSATSTTTGTE